MVLTEEEYDHYFEDISKKSISVGLIVGMFIGVIIGFVIGVACEYIRSGGF